MHRAHRPHRVEYRESQRMIHRHRTANSPKKRESRQAQSDGKQRPESADERQTSRAHWRARNGGRDTRRPLGSHSHSHPQCTVTTRPVPLLCPVQVRSENAARTVRAPHQSPDESQTSKSRNPPQRPSPSSIHVPNACSCARARSARVTCRKFRAHAMRSVARWPHSGMQVPSCLWRLDGAPPHVGWAPLRRRGRATALGARALRGIVRRANAARHPRPRVIVLTVRAPCLSPYTLCRGHCHVRIYVHTTSHKTFTRSRRPPPSAARLARRRRPDQ